MKYFSAILINLLIAGNAYAMAGRPAGEGKEGGSILGLLLPMIIVFAIFYLLLIRPQQKQQKKMRSMIESLQKGDEVITRGGIHGKIHGMADGILSLEIADNVRVKINKEYVGVVKNKEIEPKK